MNDIIIHIKDGQVTNKEPVYKFFKALHDGSYLAKFQPRKVRTNSQNAYYWMILPLIMEGLRDVGYNEVKDKEDVHVLLRQMFLKRRIVNEKTGEIIGELSRHTSELSVNEFSEYLDRITQWCAEYLSMDLPQPNQQLSIVK